MIAADTTDANAQDWLLAWAGQLIDKAEEANFQS
jgi:hypothetical protein